eukprot:CAMPEP_0174232182 /NCGR_PEP_ID=MMETSP0417-20130205/2539_1 /TAXON_ID=242541 /ORGANISM="Mayorella sp, Strain BSH-02190019" /LENGTH=1527 /DNA_ID=CAMNT_0015310191 /DNA_START=325 /DNA_END=4908 /DNA_ORIENTATION=-
MSGRRSPPLQRADPHASPAAAASPLLGVSPAPPQKREHRDEPASRSSSRPPTDQSTPTSDKPTESSPTAARVTVGLAESRAGAHSEQHQHQHQHIFHRTASQLGTDDSDSESDNESHSELDDTTDGGEHDDCDDTQHDDGSAHGVELDHVTKSAIAWLSTGVQRSQSPTPRASAPAHSAARISRSSGVPAASSPPTAGTTIGSRPRPALASPTLERNVREASSGVELCSSSVSALTGERDRPQQLNEQPCSQANQPRARGRQRSQQRALGWDEVLDAVPGHELRRCFSSVLLHNSEAAAAFVRAVDSLGSDTAPSASDSVPSLVHAHRLTTVVPATASTQRAVGSSARSRSTGGKRAGTRTPSPVAAAASRRERTAQRRGSRIRPASSLARTCATEQSTLLGGATQHSDALLHGGKRRSASTTTMPSDHVFHQDDEATVAKASAARRSRPSSLHLRSFSSPKLPSVGAQSAAVAASALSPQDVAPAPVADQSAAQARTNDARKTSAGVRSRPPLVPQPRRDTAGKRLRRFLRRKSNRYAGNLFTSEHCPTASNLDTAYCASTSTSARPAPDNLVNIQSLPSLVREGGRTESAGNDQILRCASTPHSLNAQVQHGALAAPQRSLHSSPRQPQHGLSSRSASPAPVRSRFSLFNTLLGRKRRDSDILADDNVTSQKDLSHTLLKQLVEVRRGHTATDILLTLQSFVHDELESVLALDSSANQTDCILLLCTQVLQMLGIALSASLTPVPGASSAASALSPAALFEVDDSLETISSDSVHRTESTESNQLASASFSSLLGEDQSKGLSSVAALIDQVVANTRVHLKDGKPLLSYMAFKATFSLVDNKAALERLDRILPHYVLIYAVLIYAMEPSSPRDTILHDLEESFLGQATQLRAAGSKSISVWYVEELLEQGSEACVKVVNKMLSAGTAAADLLLESSPLDHWKQVSVASILHRRLHEKDRKRVSLVKAARRLLSWWEHENRANVAPPLRDADEEEFLELDSLDNICSLANAATSLRCRICENDVRRDQLSSHTDKCAALMKSELELHEVDRQLAKTCEIVTTLKNSKTKWDEKEFWLLEQLGALAESACRIKENDKTYDRFVAHIRHGHEEAIKASHTSVARLYDRLKQIVCEKKVILLRLEHLLSGNRELGISRIREPSIADFHFSKWVTKGAYGSVYIASKESTGDIYAIKTINKSAVTNRKQIRRVWDEREILTVASSDFVVKMYYTFETRDKLFMVMEYCPGGDLFSLLELYGTLSPDVARFYIAELVLALDYLHMLGIVHRDVKPDNVLLDEDGHVKLTDFGLSSFGMRTRQRESISLKQRRSVRGDSSNLSCVGTPDYIAPEVLLNEGHSHGVDWWAVGVLTYELLVGYRPFQRESIVDTFQAIILMELSIPRTLPSTARSLISGLLTLDPGNRLGRDGGKDIKEHPFFSGIEWNAVRYQTAPFVPQLKDVEDTSYFDVRSQYWQQNTPSLVRKKTLRREQSTAALQTEPPPQYTSDFAGFWYVNAMHLASLNNRLLMNV